MINLENFESEVREFDSMIAASPVALKLVLGDLGTRILESMRLCPINIEGINIMSGLSKICIEKRIPFLKDIDFIKDDGGVYSLSQKGKQYLEELSLY
ncbi:MAG: hypothetical protein ACFFCS_09815 [Candidatus Hodarchaeota archaeon]